MNWVGGSLHRHSKASGGFKRRKPSLHARLVSPYQSTDAFITNFKPNFLKLGEVPGNDIEGLPNEAVRDGYKHKRNRQRKLEEFPNVAPLVHKLGSLGRHNPDSLRQSKDPRLKYRAIKTDIGRMEGFSAAQPILIEDDEEESQPDSEIRLASDVGTMEKQAEGIGEKVTQILSKRDWAGLTFARPMPINLAKRRKDARKTLLPTLHDLPRYQEGSFRCKRKRQESPQELQSDECWMMTGALPVDSPSIDVKIGDNALEGTVLSMAADDSEAYHPHRQASEVMLLDNEEDVGTIIYPPKDELLDRYTLTSSKIPKLRSSIWQYNEEPATLQKQLTDTKITLDDSQRTTPKSIVYSQIGISRLQSTGISFDQQLAYGPLRYDQPDISVQESLKIKKGCLGSVAELDADPNHFAGQKTCPVLNIHAVATNASLSPEPMDDLDLAYQIGGLNPTKAGDQHLQLSRAQQDRRKSSQGFDADEDCEPVVPLVEAGLSSTSLSTPSAVRNTESLAGKPIMTNVFQSEDEEDASWRRFVFGDSDSSIETQEVPNRATSIANNQASSMDSTYLTGLSNTHYHGMSEVPSSPPLPSRRK